MKILKRVLLASILCVFQIIGSYAQWIPTSGPTSNYGATALVASGSNLFAGTTNFPPGGSVFRSSDNGTTWTEVNTGLPNAQVNALAVSGTDLFAGTSGNGIYLSTNNGTGWTAVNTGLTNNDINDIVISGSNLFAATGNGVFRSSDNGATWSQVNNGLPIVSILSLLASGSILVASTNFNGIYRSLDNGESWTLSSNLGNVFSFASIGSTLFAGTFNDNGEGLTAGFVYCSIDNGSSWQYAGLSTVGIRSLVAIGSNLFVGTFGSGVFVTTDNGTSWTGVSTGLGGLSRVILSLEVLGSNLFAGTADGFFLRPLSEMVTTIASFNPIEGVSGTTVTITGSGFSTTPANNIVKFNGTTAVVTASTATTITTTVPFGATTGNITITIAGNTTASAAPFTVNEIVPIITSFAPVSGAIGTTVTIVGTNFNPAPANNRVYFGAINVTPSSGNATSLTVTVPPGATSIAPITVQDITSGLQASSVTSSTKWFTVTTSPTVPLSYSISTVAGEGGLVKIGDFNGDGKVDLATLVSNSVNIRLGNGLGGFSLTNVVDVDDVPIDLSIGDFNRDGKVDLATANYNSNSVSIRLGDGLGGFSGNTEISVGLKPYALAIGDFNADGKIDLATANFDANSLSIRLSDGLGNFFGNTEVAVGLRPYAIALGDFNQDGKADLAVSISGSAKVSIQLGDGLGNFSENTGVDGNSPNPLAVGDYNGDGKADLAVGFSGESKIKLRLGDGIGGFSGFTDIAVPTYATALASGDFNGDGKADLAYSDFSVNVKILLGDGLGGFSGNTSIPVGDKPISLEVGDFNGDGKSDLAANVIGMGQSVKVLLWAPVSVPTISFFTPTSGLIGTPVAITGTNFDPTPANNIVKFNGTTAVVTASTATSINTTVPVGATNGSITVTIGGNTATSATSFCIIPAAPTSPINGNSCGAGAVTVSVSGGTNGQYRWYTLPTGGTAILGETNSSYTTPSISATTIYYAAVNNGTCESNRTPVTATINPIPTAPTLPVNGSLCGAGAVTVSVSGGTIGQYRWYTLPTGGTAIPGETNSSYTTPSISATTNYYAAINNGTCEGARTLVTATINPIPSAPTSSGVAICANASATLNASGGTAGEYRWYTVATGGTSIVGQVNASYTTPNLAANTTYYVALNILSCESARTPVAVAVNPLPIAPTITSTKAPNNGMVLLCTENNETTTLATSPVGFAGYAWSSGQTSPSFSTNQSGNIIVRVTDSNGCQSVASATLVINSTSCKPTINTTTINTVAGGTVSQSVLSLITVVGTLDPASLRVITQPASGAIASIGANGILIVNYSGIQFVGREVITIEVCDTNGICATQTITIEVAGDVIVYNAISPNGDGLNEKMKLEYIESISPQNQVLIYNRWGDEVFKISDYDNANRLFRGETNSSDKLPAGTYFYKVMLPAAGKTLTGFILIKN